MIWNHLDILIDVRNLSKFINQGKDDEAAQLARELATHGVRLQVKPLKQPQKEEEFRLEHYSVFIDYFFSIIEFLFKSMEMNMVMVKMVEEYLLMFSHQQQFENYVQLYVTKDFHSFSGIFSFY